MVEPCAGFARRLRTHTHHCDVCPKHRAAQVQNSTPTWAIKAAQATKNRPLACCCPFLNLGFLAGSSKFPKWPALGMPCEVLQVLIRRGTVRTTKRAGCYPTKACSATVATKEARRYAGAAAGLTCAAPGGLCDLAVVRGCSNVAGPCVALEDTNDPAQGSGSQGGTFIYGNNSQHSCRCQRPHHPKSSAACPLEQQTCFPFVLLALRMWLQ